MPFLAPIVGAAAGTAGAAGAGGALASGLGSAFLGGITGAKGNQQTQGQQLQLGAAQDFASLLQQGPGAAAVSQNLGAQNDLAAELDRLRREGINPTQQDIQQQQGLAQQLFQARRVSLDQSFIKQQQDFEAAAARMGRSPLDPVFRNKLAEQQLQAQERLGAEQNVFAIQQAIQQPFQRLNLQKSRADILSGLATQALSNRQTLAGLGQNSANIQQQGFGGGVEGGLQGALGGFSRGLNAGTEGGLAGFNFAQLFAGDPNAPTTEQGRRYRAL